MRRPGRRLRPPSTAPIGHLRRALDVGLRDGHHVAVCRVRVAATNVKHHFGQPAVGTVAGWPRSVCAASVCSGSEDYLYDLKVGRQEGACRRELDGTTSEHPQPDTARHPRRTAAIEPHGVRRLALDPCQQIWL